MARKSKLNAGLIGLGIIGSRVAENLRKAGFQVYVWNRTPKPAPNFLASPAEVAGICDVVQIVVADAVALFSIIEAMSGVLAARHTVICSATVGTRATLEAARMVEATGAMFLDAPFTGSKVAAEKGELVYFIGGTGDAFRAAEPMLKATSKAIVKVGTAGEAAAVKIVTNMLAAVTVQTLVEACALLAKSGIDPAVLMKALENHGVRSGLSDMKLPKIIAGDFDTNFSVKHMFKDVQIAIQDANRFDIDIPATTATAGALYNAISQGWADLDFASVAKFYELKKVEPPAPAAPAPETPAMPAPAATPPAAEPAPATPAPPAGSATPVPQAAVKSTDAPPPSTETTVPPVEKPAEPPVGNPVPAAVETPPAVAVEESQGSQSAPVEKAKRPLPPVKPQKSTSRWFGSGRKLF
jgi:3-hydroxyisobutyrate dehydrogenase-like beta-hydroxyacid dehydrogenase